MMQPLWLLPASVLLLVPPEVQDGDTPFAAIARHPERFGELEIPRRQAWLRELLTRLDRANRVVLPPEEVVQRRAEYVLLLKESGRGEDMSADRLRRLLAEADHREQEAVDQLARRFRVQVYKTFRQRRVVFTQRRAAWNRVLADWKAAGSPFDQQNLLIDWLESALVASAPDNVGPLPTEPTFLPAADLFRPLIAQDGSQGVRKDLFGSPSIPSDSLPRTAVGLPERSGHTRRPRTPVQPRVSSGNRSQVASSLQPADTRSRAVGRQVVSGHAVAVGPSASIGRDRAELPLAAAVPSLTREPPPAPTRFESVPRDLVVTRQLPTMADPFAVAIPMASSPGAAVPPPVAMAPRDSSDGSPSVRQQRIPPSGQPISEQLPSTSLAAVPRRNFAGVGVVDSDTGPSEPPSRMPSGPVAILDTPALEPSKPTPPDLPSADPAAKGTGSQKAIEIDLDELAAGIAGSNLSQRALQAELDDGNRQWNARELGPLIDHLNRLVVRHNDLAVLRELTSAEHQALVGRPRSPRPLITQAAAKVFQARTRASGPGFVGSEAQRRAELRALDDLSRKLARMGLD